MTDKNKKQKFTPLEPLVNRSGYYAGTGTNHEKKEFRGELDLKTIVNGKGVLISYRAVGISGIEFNKDEHLYNRETVMYNEESTFICYDKNNELSLWTLNNNIGTMVKFDLRRFKQFSTKRNLYIFGFGDPLDNNVFREEITIELHENGDISYNYSWGEAGGLFLSRSTIQMKKVHS